MSSDMGSVPDPNMQGMCSDNLRQFHYVQSASSWRWLKRILIFKHPAGPRDCWGDLQSSAASQAPVQSDHSSSLRTGATLIYYL